MPQITLADMEKTTNSIYVPKDYIPFSLKPNSKDVYSSINKEFNATISINSKGFRGREFDIRKPINITRIMILGDSFTIGHGISDEKTYSAILENLLKGRNNKKFQVINGGYVGYLSPDTYYLYFKIMKVCR